MKRLALIPVLALLAGCGDKPPAAGGQTPPPMPVTVAPVIERAETEWSEVSGRVEAVALVEVRSRVAGFVDKVAFTEGALVKAGDPLFTIDARPFAAAVLRAEAEVANATARFELAQRDAARSQDLLKAEAISQETADQRAAAVAVNQAQSLRAADAALVTARLDVEYASIVAPMAGRIGRTFVTAGNLVGVGTPVLATIVATDPVYVTFDLDERTFAAARTALTAPDGELHIGLEGESAHPHRAKVDFVDNRIDPATGTIRLRALLKNPDGAFLPGAFARVRLPLSTPGPRVLVDQRAIATDQDSKYVLVVGAGNVTGYRRIVTGPAVGGLRIVREGLKSGETVVLRGSPMVRPGVTVAPMAEPQPEAAPAASGPDAAAAPTAEGTPGAAAADAAAAPAAPAAPAPAGDQP